MPEQEPRPSEPNPEDSAGSDTEFIKQLQESGVPVEQIPEEDLVDNEEAKKAPETIGEAQTLEEFYAMLENISSVEKERSILNNRLRTGKEVLKSLIEVEKKISEKIDEITTKAKEIQKKRSNYQGDTSIGDESYLIDRQKRYIKDEIKGRLRNSELIEKFEELLFDKYVPGWREVE